ncbi:nucleoside/nucleotide kinase family protein [Methanobrevibacter arboriphilus]|uniref:hypothetical protein n=1 Tax=Methanobrevibacter arboriphilus TaxID=39441 RepID=UPI000AC2D8FF|nr:hypothetical protein [Methanobrevibacter arboriphilus]
MKSECLEKVLRIFFLLSVFASPKTRFNRLKSRNRNDDSVEYEGFLKRDQRELDFGIGNVVATSDCIIINESDLETYKNQINGFFNKIFKLVSKLVFKFVFKLTFK